MKNLTLILAISALTLGVVSHDSVMSTPQNTNAENKIVLSNVHAVNCNGARILIMDDDGMYLNFCKISNKVHSVNLNNISKSMKHDDRHLFKLLQSQMQ